jgi:hypothetical protein
MAEPRTNDIPDGFYRPLSVLHERPERDRDRRYLEDPERDGLGEAHLMDLLYRGVAHKQISFERWVEPTPLSRPDGQQARRTR